MALVIAFEHQWLKFYEKIFSSLDKKRHACRCRQGFLYSFYKSLDSDSLFLYCSMLSEQSGMITRSEARLCFRCWFVSLGQLFSPSHCQGAIITYSFQNQSFITISSQESVAGSVIQATGTVEFEDGLRMGVLQEDCWCPNSGPATLEADMARPWRPALTQM